MGEITRIGHELHGNNIFASLDRTVEFRTNTDIPYYVGQTSGNLSYVWIMTADESLRMYANGQDITSYRSSKVIDGQRVYYNGTGDMRNVDIGEYLSTTFTGLDITSYWNYVNAHSKPVNPTFSLDVYSQGKVNPLYTFLWSDLQNPVEERNYYIEVRAKQPLLPQIDGYILADNVPFENGSVTSSYEDLHELSRSTVPQVEIVVKLFHWSDVTVAKEYDDVKTIQVNNIGTIESESEGTTTHPDTSPTTDDDYNEGSDILINPHGGSDTSLDNLMTSSYVVTSQELIALKNFLWSADFTDNIKLLNNSPIENIVSIKTLPFSVGTTTEQTIKIGNVNTGISAKATSTNHTFDGLSVQIPRKYNSFLDFEPYSSLSLYLPFIGVHDLPTNLLIGHTLNVVYKFDILTGAICVILKCDNTPFDYVMGNCGIDLPISAQNRTQVEIAQQRARVNGTANAISGVANAIGGVASAMGSLAKGNVFGAVSSGASVVGGLAQTGASAYNSYLDYATATYHTTTKGVIGSQIANYVSNECYLIVDRPIYTQPSTYAHDYGYPCELSLTLGNLKGFTQCSHSLELSGIPCTNDEREELRNLLTSGVYFTSENIEDYSRGIEHNTQLRVFKNSSDLLDTNKKLSELFTLGNVVWKEDTNAFNPTFIVHKTDNWRRGNYICVKMLGIIKFYYITDIVMKKGGLLELNCHCDVLMTYNTYLRGIKTIVTRQEFKNNRKLVDNNVAVPCNREIVTQSLGQVGVTNASIILTVTN